MDLLGTTLKQNGEPRWNSHLEMFKSVLKNWNEIEGSVDSIDNKNQDIRFLVEQLRVVFRIARHYFNFDQI